MPKMTPCQSAARCHRGRGRRRRRRAGRMVETHDQVTVGHSSVVGAFATSPSTSGAAGAGPVRISVSVAILTSNRSLILLPLVSISADRPRSVGRAPDPRPSRRSRPQGDAPSAAQRSGNALGTQSWLWPHRARRDPRAGVRLDPGLRNAGPEPLALEDDHQVGYGPRQSSYLGERQRDLQAPRGARHGQHLAPEAATAATCSFVGAPASMQQTAVRPEPGGRTGGASAGDVPLQDVRQPVGVQILGAVLRWPFRNRCNGLWRHRAQAEHLHGVAQQL